MNTFFNHFKTMCDENNITFDTKNQRVRCLAHIINLAAQDALKSLKGTGPESEEEVLDDKNPIGVIAKVRFNINLFSYYNFYIHIIILINYIVLNVVENLSS